MDDVGNRIALLIDAENAPAARIGAILAEATRHGTVAERRAYGNWTGGNLKPWVGMLQKHSIRRRQQTPVCRGKNASDMALVVDAMDLLHTGSFNAFAIVTSDSDFTPLVRRILKDGVAVYGFGEKKTPKPLVDACTEFIHIERLSHTAPIAAESRNLLTAKRLTHLLRRAVDAAGGDDGWAHLSQVRKQLGDRASFDPRNYGHRKLGKLIESTGLFDVRRRNLVVHVRNRRTT